VSRTEIRSSTGWRLGDRTPRRAEFTARAIDYIFDINWPGEYSFSMITMQGGASRTQYQSRPGRHAVVAASLSDLQGPTEGTVELPIWLYWSSLDGTFDLADRDMRRWLYQIVLREAGRVEDLTAHLDGGMLIALWPDLYLPKGIRLAWEDQHPALRAAAA
jgi:hypothetical protein